mmetsp:Transcript_7581/g.14048  ORF Transcript_7581/g.14048 Transcript_7581/m.14048 type:complete len:153 (+) Transcript_7581:104-562(+)
MDKRYIAGWLSDALAAAQACSFTCLVFAGCQHLFVTERGESGTLVTSTPHRPLCESRHTIVFSFGNGMKDQVNEYFGVGIVGKDIVVREKHSFRSQVRRMVAGGCSLKDQAAVLAQDGGLLWCSLLWRAMPQAMDALLTHAMKEARSMSRPM